jgi:hypothetical protein
MRPRTASIPLIGMLSVCALVVVACSGTEGEATDDEIISMPSSSAKASPGPASTTVSGVLGFDDIEGGCSFIEAADGTRYEVVYPNGWALDRTQAELRADDGGVVRAGERLTVRGAVATDRSSICQIGPIFVATSVEPATP